MTGMMLCDWGHCVVQATQVSTFLGGLRVAFDERGEQGASRCYLSDLMPALESHPDCPGGPQFSGNWAACSCLIWIRQQFAKVQCKEARLQLS